MKRESHKIVNAVCAENQTDGQAIVSKKMGKKVSKKVGTTSLTPLARATRMALVGLGLVQGVSQAATIEVTSNADDGTGGCTLREAIVSVNTALLQGDCTGSGAALGTDDSITFANSLPSNTITLSSGELGLTVSSTVFVDASMVSGGITVDGDGISRAFYASSATLSIDNMTITGGTASNGGGIMLKHAGKANLTNSTVSGNLATARGGGIYARFDSSVSLSNSTVSGNSAIHGGGIYAYDSTMILSNSTVSGNLATFSGGGIYVGRSFFGGSSSVSLSNSTVSGNLAPRGGGIHIYVSTMSLSNSTVSGNSATSLGGGIHVFYSTMSLSNSTVSGNSAASSGGGISAGDYATISLSNSTVSGNSASSGGGGIYVNDSSSVSQASSVVSLSNSTVSDNSVTSGSGGGVYVAGSVSLGLSNSIIANSLGGGDCSGNAISFIISDAVSIIEDGGCGSMRAIDPGLEPLADNGGPTQTHALSANSAARNSGINCGATDQRGEPRNDGACDVGAFEFMDDSFFVIPIGNGRVAVVPL